MPSKIADACNALGVPVVSGNVSLYNETDGQGILPTPGLAMVGLYEGPSAKVRGRLHRDGLVVALLGKPGDGHLGGSLYAREVLGQPRRGAPPPVAYAAERALHDALRRLVHAGAVEVTHDLSDGGLLVALAELCLPSGYATGADGADAPAGLGGRFQVPDDVGLAFGEDHGRALVAYDPARAVEVRALCGDVPLTELGVSGGAAFVVNGQSLPVAALVSAWRDRFPEWVEG